MDMENIAQQVERRFPGAVRETISGGFILEREFLLVVFAFLKSPEVGCEGLHSIAVIDRKEHLEVVYHLTGPGNHSILTVKLVLAAGDPTTNSLTSLWDSANWLEREAFDLSGVRFLNHPDLRRILNPEEWTGHPLRKDFAMDGIVPRPAR